jgi:uncharacterized protein (TIGR03435 family)
MAAAAGAASGQQPGFEVASIRAGQVPAGRGQGLGRERIQLSPDTLTLRNESLRTCIRWAYDVSEYQVSGPDWLASTRFDIVAKSAGPATNAQMRQMLQTLLAERFKLVLHRQTKETSVYVLAVGRNGPKFRPSETEGETAVEPNAGRQSVAVQRAPVAQLIDILSNILRAPVLDETGLEGRYDITVNVAKYIAERGPDGLLDPVSLIMTGLQEELGLKLESRKTPLEILIVDRMEKVPSEN